MGNTQFRPDNFMLMPVMACQASCRYCFAKKTGAVMNRETAVSALDFIARSAPAKKDFHLTFHGGEPLLAGEAFYRWILPEIVSRFGRRAHISIQSNLWGITDSFAELFAKYRVSVGTSIDGPKDMCDGQRGEGYYDKTMAGVKILHRHGISTGNICTFTSASAHRAGEVFKSSRQPYSVHGAVAPMESPGGEGTVSPGQMARILLDSYEAYKADPSRCRITTIDAMAKGSFDGRGVICTFFDCLGAFAAIDPKGDVYSCQRFCGMQKYAVGNVLAGLTEEKILESHAYKLLRRVQDGKKRACGACSRWDHCMGGCLYSAIVSGSEKDPYCEAYKAVFDRISHDMALEMGFVMLGRNVPVPVLAMAGERKHPCEQRRSRERMKQALEKGKSPEGFGDLLRSRYPENDLNKLYLHVTFACPLKCDHCYAEGGTAICPELTAERFAQIVQEAADKRFRSVVVTGGEPLAYEGFEELCALLQRADRKGTKLILRTSLGFPVSAGRLQMICALFDEIVVSIDGDRQSHDRRRGAGRYDMAAANIKSAADSGFAGRISLAAALTREQADGKEGQGVYELAAQLGIKKVRIRPVLPIGRAQGILQEAWQICAEETEPDERFYPRHSCGLGQNLYVKPDGSAYPCYAWCAPDKKLGDLSLESLGDLMKRGGLQAYCRHDVDTNKKCRTCQVRYLCGGICRAWATDKEDVDSGNFDCTGRKNYYRMLAEKWMEG